MRHEQDLKNIEHESSRRNIYFKLIMEYDGNRGWRTATKSLAAVSVAVIVVGGVRLIVFMSRTQSVIQFSTAAAAAPAAKAAKNHRHFQHKNDK